MLHRDEAIRRRTPDGVRQALWGIAKASNLVRLELAQAAAKAQVLPSRISFVNALMRIVEVFAALAPRAPSRSAPFPSAQSAFARGSRASCCRTAERRAHTHAP